MSRTTRTHVRTALSVLLVSGAALAGGAPPGAAAVERPRHWAGYAIPATGQAAGGWIGGWRMGRTPVYVTTPQRRPNHAGFRGSRRVGDLPGKAASRADTSRAAWILSKYGDYRDATQAAAVDASVLQLLAGERWQVHGVRGARRIRQSGDPAAVRRFARFMLRQSRLSAGAYTARLAAEGADLGGSVAVTLSVRDGHGRPAPGLPVTLAMGSAQPLSAVTGDDGRAVGRFAADARGWQDVTASVGNVPEHRLRLWLPRRPKQAAVAEGGARRRLVVSASAAVRGPQTLALTADPAQLVVGSATRVLVTVGGESTSRPVTATLHGPFATSAQAACTGPDAGTVQASVAGDGGYALPAMTMTGGGYYAWRVQVAGTDTSVPVAACGATVKVRSRAVVGIASDAAAAPVGELGATASISGLPFPDQVSATATLAGPYASAQAAAVDGCATSAGEATRQRAGNGTVHFTVAVSQAGVYAWQVQAAPGDLWLGSRSGCASGGSVVTVQ